MRFWDNLNLKSRYFGGLVTVSVIVWANSGGSCTFWEVFRRLTACPFPAFGGDYPALLAPDPALAKNYPAFGLTLCAF